MDYKINKLGKGQLEITVEVSILDLQPYLEKAAKHLSAHYKISGFRPGKAPYEMVKANLGEIKIYEEAADSVIKKTFVEIVAKEKLATLGSPEIKIEKLAPDNPFVYQAKINLLPDIKMADLAKIKVKRKEIEINPEKIKKTLQDLAQLRASERLVDRSTKETDKVEIDMEMFKDKVPVEGGVAKSHFVYLADNNYIPGFNEKLIGLQKNDEKQFQLTFPKSHYNKNLAGQLINFKIKVKNIYERSLPDTNDDFAKSVGNFKNINELEEQIKNNLLEEEKQREEQRLETEMLEQIAENSQFEEIPEILITSEKEKMVEELKENIYRQGLDFEKYLEHIKKTEEELKKEFSDQAIKRIKVALILRQIQIDEKLSVKQEEIDRQISRIKEIYSKQPSSEQLADLETESYHDYLSTILANRKAINFLKEKIIK